MEHEEKQLSIRSGLFMVVAGLACMGYFGWIYMQQSAAKSWPKAMAKVTTSHIESSKAVSAKRGARTLYHARIQYEYTVGGKQYVGSDLWFDSEPMSTDRGDMKKLTAQYPLGKKMKVFYDPQNPATAVVTPGKNSAFAKWAILGGAFSLLIGGYLAWSGYSSLQSTASSRAEMVPLHMDISSPRDTIMAEPVVEPEEYPTPPQEEICTSPLPSEHQPLKQPAPRKGRSLLVRILAGLIGFPVLLLFGAVTVVSLIDCLNGPDENASTAVEVTAMLISLGITLFGLWLASICCLNRRRTQSWAEAS